MSPSSAGLFRVRSGLMRSQVSPRLTERKRNCMPWYTMFGLCGERTVGASHCPRSAGSPSATFGRMFTDS